MKLKEFIQFLTENHRNLYLVPDPVSGTVADFTDQQQAEEIAEVMDAPVWRLERLPELHEAWTVRDASGADVEEWPEEPEPIEAPVFLNSKEGGEK